MALPFDPTPGVRDAKALAILAKTIYRELRSSGYAEKDVMVLAGELLGMVATEVSTRRGTSGSKGRGGEPTDAAVRPSSLDGLKAAGAKTDEAVRKAAAPAESPRRGPGDSPRKIASESSRRLTNDASDRRLPQD
jgi:hypothetical protein